MILLIILLILLAISVILNIHLLKERNYTGVKDSLGRKIYKGDILEGNMTWYGKDVVVVKRFGGWGMQLTGKEADCIQGFDERDFYNFGGKIGMAIKKEKSK